MKFISVPLNDIGEKEYDHGGENSPNLIVIELPEQEFTYLKNSSVFNMLNEDFGLMIDDYESEVIPLKALNKVSKNIDEKSAPIFSEAIHKAQEKQTFVGLDF